MRSIIRAAADDLVRSAVEHGSLNEMSAARSMSRMWAHMQRDKTPWAVVTAYRSAQQGADDEEKARQLRKNKANNVALLGKLRAAIAPVAGHEIKPVKLMGRWPTKEIPDNMSIEDAMAKGLIGEGDLEREESFFVMKPEDMEQDEFEALIHRLGNEYEQDSVMVSDGNKVWYLKRDGTKDALGSVMQFDQHPYWGSMLARRSGPPLGKKAKPGKTGKSSGVIFKY